MRRRGRVRVYIGKDVVGAGWRAQQAAAELIGGREQQFEKKKREVPNTVCRDIRPYIYLLCLSI